MAMFSAARVCKLCKSATQIRVVGPQFPGDETFRKTAPVVTCPHCDAPSELPKKR